MKSNILKKIGFIVGVFLLVSIVFCEDIPITILHTNDIHGQNHSFDYNGKKYQFKNIGGAARRATLISKIKKENKHKIFLFDIGDIAGRGEYRDYYGEPEIKIMNFLKYDLMTLGNHEFKFNEGTKLPKEETLNILDKRIKEAKFPILCANVYQNGKRIFKPYVILKEKGVRLAVVGMTTPKIKTYGLPINYVDPNEEMRKVLTELTGKYDILVFASHVGDLFDLALSKNYPEIDLIIEGDFHTFLFEPNKITKYAKYPDQINYTPICQTGELGVCLGKIDLVIGENNNKYYIKSFESKLIPVTSEYKENIFVNQILEKYNICENYKPVLIQ